MKRKASTQEVFDELENIIKRSKKDGIVTDDIVHLREQINDHLFSIERKLETKTLKEDWLPFKVDFYIDEVSRDEYDDADFESRDVLYLQIPGLKLDTKIIVDYRYTKHYSNGDELQDIKLGGSTLWLPSLTRGNKTHLVDAISWILAKFGHFEHDPDDLADVRQDIRKAVSTFICQKL